MGDDSRNREYPFLLGVSPVRVETSDDGEHTPRSIHRAILDLAAVRLRNAAPVKRGEIGLRSAVGQTVRRKIDAPRVHSRRIGCANRIGTRVA